MKLVLDHVRKAYAGKDVLKDCSYTFEGTGIHVLRGPNGCGKSTLLRICALLESPDAGELHFTDSGSKLPMDMHLRRRMTLVLPHTGVFSMTTLQNVAYGLRLRGSSVAYSADAARRALSIVGLEHKARQSARTLSSGETQRMGLARALAIEPEVLFLDEPTASVDEENRAIIESVVLRLRQEGRTLIVMTTHDRDQSERLADRTLIMNHGVIIPG
jgi:tungstate transport system ATP-binding protein